MRCLNRLFALGRKPLLEGEALEKELLWVSEVIHQEKRENQQLAYVGRVMKYDTETMNAYLRGMKYWKRNEFIVSDEKRARLDIIIPSLEAHAKLVDKEKQRQKAEALLQSQSPATV